MAPMVKRAAHRSRHRLRPTGWRRSAAARLPSAAPPPGSPSGSNCGAVRHPLHASSGQPVVGISGAASSLHAGADAVWREFSAITEQANKSFCPRWGGRTTRTHDLQITEGDHMRLTLCQLSYKDGGM